jgi:hypothetical protein
MNEARTDRSEGEAMRTIGVMLALLLSGVAQAGPGSGLPSGKYTGTADWRGPGGSTGTYTVEKDFDGTTMTARYAWTDTQAREEKHTVTFAAKSAEPLFDVVDEKGQIVGKGYCYDDACSYRAAFGPINIDESFRWSKGGMTVLGAKSGPGFSVVWKESLQSR